MRVREMVEGESMLEKKIYSQGLALWWLVLWGSVAKLGLISFYGAKDETKTYMLPECKLVEDV